jgi:hypothetical protein
MATNDELKWTRRGSWRFIPDRYQALVACLVAGLLYINIFDAFFGFRSGRDGSCGSFFRPVLTESDSYDTGWFWHSTRDAFQNYSEALYKGTLQTFCPGAWKGVWWEALASFVGLAICGVVLRRAIKREQAKSTS